MFKMFLVGCFDRNYYGKNCFLCSGLNVEIWRLLFPGFCFRIQATSPNIISEKWSIKIMDSEVLKNDYQ
jgi:hypothetical protein